MSFFFCSREHQKLVWKTHGKVCGDKSNPFYPPDFFEDELELARRYMPAMRPMFSMWLQRPPMGIDQAALDVLKDTSKMSNWTPREHSRNLGACRSALNIALTRAKCEPAHFRTLDHFLLLTGLEDTFDEGIEGLPALHEPVYSFAMHRGLILLTLIRHTSSKPLPPSYNQATLDRFCLHGYQELLDTLLPHLPNSGPKLALTIEMVNHLSPLVFAGFPGSLKLDTVKGANPPRLKAVLTPKSRS
ncbi:hypothetical protein JCM10207_004840 [Rhodosporidiobolus poonsookiae]